MAISQGGVSDVIDERVEDGEYRDREDKSALRAGEQQDAEECADRENEIADEDDANKERVRVKKIGERMFSARPGGDDSLARETQEKQRFLPDEGIREMPLFGEVGVFTDLCIVARFLEARDASNAADGMFVKNIIVADPEFKRKARTDGNQAMKRRVVAYGPRQATKNNQCAGKGGTTPGSSDHHAGAPSGPEQQKGKSDPERGICEKRERAKGAVG